MSVIEMISVISSNVQSIGYDVSTRTLRVCFNNNATYDYHDVGQMEYEALKSAPSIGSYLNRHIKNTYAYERVG
jgi:hypothetical protein